MIRAFVAVESDEALRLALGRRQEQIGEQLTRELRDRDIRVQWVRPESIHVTLKFLGDVPEQSIDHLARTLSETAPAHEPFVLEVGGLGVFPDLRAPRVLWAGLTDPPGEAGGKDRIMNLASSIEAALDRLGFPPEGRPFNPHVTLARIKEGGREVGRALARSGVMEQSGAIGLLHVKAVSLMRSDLRPSGSVYTRLSESPLGKNRR
jgi:2'-5' RNA ligase